MKRITVGRALTILSDLDVDTRGVNSEYARGVAEALAHALGYRPGEVARAAGGLLALHEALGTAEFTPDPAAPGWTPEEEELDRSEDA